MSKLSLENALQVAEQLRQAKETAYVELLNEKEARKEVESALEKSNAERIHGIEEKEMEAERLRAELEKSKFTLETALHATERLSRTKDTLSLELLEEKQARKEIEAALEKRLMDLSIILEEKEAESRLLEEEIDKSKSSLESALQATERLTQTKERIAAELSDEKEERKAMEEVLDKINLESTHALEEKQVETRRLEEEVEKAKALLEAALEETKTLANAKERLERELLNEREDRKLMEAASEKSNVDLSLAYEDKKAETKRLEEEIEKTKSSLQTTLQENRKLVETKEAIETELLSEIETRKQVEATLEKSNLSEMELSNQRDILVSRLASMEECVLQLKQNLSKMDQTRASEKNQLMDEKQALSRVIEELDGRCKNQMERIADLLKEQEERASRLLEIQEELQELQRTVSDKEMVIQEMKLGSQDLEGASTKAELLMGTIQQLQEELESTNAELADMRSKESVTESKYLKAQSLISRLREQLATGEQQLEDRQQRISQLELDVDRLSSRKVDFSDGEKEELLTELEKCRVAVEDKEEEAVTALMKYESMLKKNHKLKMKVRRLEALQLAQKDAELKHSRDIRFDPHSPDEDDRQKRLEKPTMSPSPASKRARPSPLGVRNV
uniref:Uncharacterized protein n=1 Tax=Compsopogon caeruleus TaxID=31354 RepID=A0A7S1T7K8_9RHOD